MFREISRRHFLTSNTIRYRIEYRCLKTLLIEAQLTPGTLLDAGAGSGEMSKRLFNEGFCRELKAIEPFEPNFRLLKENFRNCDKAEVFQATLSSLPISSESIDLAISTQVFEHIEDHESAAGELVRTLKIGGAAIISVPHPPEISPNPEHVRPGYTEEELTALFQPFGMKLIRSEYFFTLRTQFRLIAAQELPLRGVFLPLSWADREKNLSNAERKKGLPYGIASLFVKEKPSPK